jgi:hypothetical protein
MDWSNISGWACVYPLLKTHFHRFSPRLQVQGLTKVHYVQSPERSNVCMLKTKNVNFRAHVQQLLALLFFFVIVRNCTASGPTCVGSATGEKLFGPPVKGHRLKVFKPNREDWFSLAELHGFGLKGSLVQPTNNDTTKDKNICPRLLPHRCAPPRARQPGPADRYPPGPVDRDPAGE